MKSSQRTFINSTIVGLGLFGMAAGALADPPRWSNARGYQDYDRPARYDYAPRYDYARVVDVDPIVTRVRVDSPQRDCWVEQQEVYRQRGIDNVTAGPTVLGAIIGGVIGHQFGSGRGRDAATVAGTVIGASIGHSSASQAAGPQTEVRDVRRCETSYQSAYEDHVEAYRVTYVYGGREYTTRMPYDPGSRVRVQVGVGVVN